LVSFERVWLFLLPTDVELEAEVVPLLHAALGRCVIHTLRSELAGETVQLDSCPPELSNCTVTSVSESVDITSAAGVALPTSAPDDFLRVTLSQETISQVEGLQALQDSAGLLDVHVQKLHVTWALASPQIFLADVFVSAFSSAGSLLGTGSASLTDLGRLIYRIPIQAGQHLAALSPEEASLPLDSVALNGNEDLQERLQLFDRNFDMALDGLEMAAAQSLLLTRVWFWECVEYLEGEHRWEAGTCEAVAVEPGFVTCACTHSATFAVTLGQGSCGDARVTDGEQCDDGNTADGDGCSASCQVEALHGWFCSEGDTAQKSVCSDSSNCPPWHFGLNCEYLCSQALDADNKCLGSRFSPTAFQTQAIDGAVGGLVRVESGESINIPSGAFSGIVTFSLRVYADAKFEVQEDGSTDARRRDGLAATLPCGPVVSVGPHALAFRTKAILMINYDDVVDEREESSLKVYSLDGAGKWRPLEETHMVDTTRRVIKVLVWSTGTFVVMHKQQPDLVEQLSALSPGIIVALVLAPTFLLAVAAFVLYRKRRAPSKDEGSLSVSSTSGDVDDTSSRSKTSQDEIDDKDTDVDIVILRDMVHIDPLPEQQALNSSILMEPEEVDDTLVGTLGFAWERASRSSRASSPAASSDAQSTNREGSVPIQSLVSWARDSDPLPDAARPPPPRRESAAGASFGAAAGSRDGCSESVAGQQVMAAAGAGRISEASLQPTLNYFAASLLDGRNDLLASVFAPRDTNE